jgi:uncharacterized protein YbjQ (UPF0145 family)
MTTWDGQGLPPAAQARVARFGSTQVRTSLLSVPAALTLDSVGLDTVGEVMGCMVQQIGWQGYGGCGMWGSSSAWGGYSPGYMTSTVASSTSRFAAYGPYVQAVNAGYHTALGRMVTEAAALGADGVVGVRLSGEPLGEGNREFLALGTAVRARSHTRPSQLFTTDLPGTDVAKLLVAGWVPVAVQVALEVAIRHDDYATRNQAGGWWLNTGNIEVSGYTELVQHTRGFARDRLARQISGLGADGGVVSDMRLSVWAIEPGEGHRDHVAEAVITGTALARFARRDARPASTLTILPLRPSGGPTDPRVRG